MRAREYRGLADAFNLTCENYVSAVTREIEANLAVLRSVAAFTEAASPLDRGAFESFARREVEAHPTILALEWLARVPESQRTALEQKLTQQEGRPVRITEGTPSNSREAAPRPEYFPVALMYPRTAADKVIGFDTLSQPQLAKSLARARDSGKPVVTGKIPLVEVTLDGYGIPSYFAVSRGGDLAGFVLAIFEVARVLENGVGQLNPRQINIQFYDLSAPRGKRLLHFHPADARATPIPEEKALAAAEFQFVRRFTVGGREWAIVCAPSPKYSTATLPWLPWIVLFTGLAGTMAIVAYISLSVAYATRAEGLVKQLYQINAHLTTEIQERKKAEDEISRLNAGLEQRVNDRTEALRESKERYELAATGSKDGLWDWNLLTNEIYYSPRWKNMLGCADEEISNDPEEWFRRIHPDEARRVRAEIAAHFSGDTPHFQSEYRVRHRDGAYRWMLSRGVAVFDERRCVTRMAGSQTDITEGKVADPLTGLPNRVFLNDKLQQAIERMWARETRLFAVLFLDLDRFKLLNDSLGHNIGDRLLMAISGRLNACAAAARFPAGRITVARLGGDEFAILLDGIETAEDATLFAGRIQAAMKPAFDLEGHNLFASCSIGVALGRPDTNPEDLLRDADMAMYHAKHSGKQRYEIFDAGMRQRSIARLALETDLRGAVQNGELELYYQPKVSLTDGRLAEFEALLRWNHPERGVIQPADFIPLADETGMIVQIGEWVLLEACRQLSEWRERFVCDVGISVNLSTRQFEQPELLDRIRRALADTGLPPGCLSLEITESLLVRNAEDAIHLLNQLREMGIGLKIDDFGTGFSSLSYLHRLPFNELKIDQSFIAGIGTGPDTMHIVRAIIALARALGMSVVAEGVETPEQLLKLAAYGCDYAQGRLFSEPLPASEAALLIVCPDPLTMAPPSSASHEDLAALGDLFRAAGD